jgi:vacuolar-type H+-ATPase subunit H
MIMAGELRYRHSETAQREWLIQRKAELIEEAKQREEERHRAFEEEARRREQERIDRLLEEAETLQKAETIRLYVARVRQFNATLSDPASNSVVEEWAKHALAQADRIDPVISGRFIQVE